MTTVKRFEDLRVWQNARELVRFIYQMTAAGDFNRDFGLRDQIRRAAASIMHNIAEGFEAGSDADFVRFLGYARRSASETRSQGYIALDQQYITDQEFHELYKRLEETAHQINAFISYLHTSSKNKTFKEPPTEYSVEWVDQPDPLDRSNQFHQLNQSAPSDELDELDKFDELDELDHLD